MILARSCGLLEFSNRLKVIQGFFLGGSVGVMDRLVLSDGQWERRISKLINGRPGRPGSTSLDNRLFVEAVLWIARTGSPWRDLPEAFGEWNSVFRHFSRWSAKGVWLCIFEALVDVEYLNVDFRINMPAARAGKETVGQQTSSPRLSTTLMIGEGIGND